MAWPFLGGIIKIVVTYGFDGKPAVNIHFVLQRTPESPVPDAALEDAADAIHAGYAAQWDEEMGTNWDITNVTALDYSREDGSEIQTSGALPIVGLEVSEEVPASVALVVSHRTDRTGRSRRGRTYLAGLTEGNVGGNSVDAGATTAAGDLFAAIALNLDGVDMDHVVYSLVSGGENRITPEATLVTSHVINERVDTQRRRLPS